MTKKPNCPYCGGRSINKDLKQNRFRCKVCGKTFTHVVDEDIEIVTKTKTNQYKTEKIVLSAIDEVGKIMDINKYCEFYGLPRADIRSYKLVTHTGTPFYNIAFHEKDEEVDFITEEFIQTIVDKNIGALQLNIDIPKPKSSNVIRGIYTDMHIGMDPDKKGISVYGGTWTYEDQLTRITEFACDVVTSGKDYNASKCIIDELGDNVDGLDAQTVRKGHDLPQNLNNREMFDNAVHFKILLCDVLIASKLFSHIIFNNICNDNHAGDFGYMVNSCVKAILSVKYPNVSVVNHSKFINHYTIGKHTKIISHGKDMEDSKFGFKPKLDQPGEKKITNYILSNKLTGHIEFSKGDSHQCLYDYCTSDIFDYLNHGSFAPPSQWVQTNFQKGRAGYSIQTFNENDSVTPVTIPRFF